jgi:aldehyde dehydrogenase (NAD+)
MSPLLLEETTRRETAAELVARLRASFSTGRTRPLEYRLKQLDGLTRFLREQELEIESALRDDMGRPAFEVYPAEIAMIASDIALARKKLRSWIKPQRVSTSLVGQPGKSWIIREPLGVVLIIGPWNYPVQLLTLPLVGAIAAGNCAILKPSELAPATSALIASRLPRYIDSECLQIVEGGVPETTALLAEQFDHIFYTGNGAVGRIVMEAAAKHLTPVTLELGGKSPCIVDRNADLDVAARRIVWGKFYNAGQTCVAPDYVLAHEAIENALLDRMKQTIRDFFGDDPRTRADFGRIVNARHHRRLVKLLESGGQVFAGGDADEHDRYIAPTILRDVPAGAAVMAEEIFGPILPVLRIKGVDDAISFVNARPKPLALYLFTNDRAVELSVIERTSCGGVTVNHTLLHVTIPSLPFGGVGQSGIGAYHGKATFETFSHRKAVLRKPTWLDPWFFYPPYNASKKSWVRRVLSIS